MSVDPRYVHLLGTRCDACGRTRPTAQEMREHRYDSPPHICWGRDHACMAVLQSALASPAPNREPTAERCEQINVFGERCAREHGHAADLLHLFGAEGRELMNLRAQLSREVEARRRAEAARDSERDKAAVNFASCERLRQERDEARAELATVGASLRDEVTARLEAEDARDRAESALATMTAARDRLRQERDHYRATVLNLPSHPTTLGAVWSGESRPTDEALAALAAPRPEHGEAKEPRDAGGPFPQWGEWRCSECGELNDSVDRATSWRWTGDAWEHWHPFVGHVDAKRVAAPPPREPAGEKGGGE